VSVVGGRGGGCTCGYWRPGATKSIEEPPLFRPGSVAASVKAGWKQTTGLETEANTHEADLMSKKIKNTHWAGGGTKENGRAKRGQEPAWCAPRVPTTERNKVLRAAVSPRAWSRGVAEP